MPLHEPRSTPPVREGDILAGKYRIEKIIGAGAMGVVVAARHLKLDERVAIKFLLPETLSNREAVARFEREGRAAVKIRSEHVVRVIDVGNLENGAPYMVMEHLEGEDLSAWLRERGPLPYEWAVDLVLQALEAVAEAHAMGIVHRDLKPSNLFCVQRNDGLLCVKVLDFGISKVGAGTATIDLGMTRTSDVMGSPLYMSPEQMESARDVDATTDIWALGVTLFQLITGRTPFVASTMPELVLRIANGAPQRLRSARPDAPPGLERVILRCLEKDRKKRYRDARELARALVEFGPTWAHASADRIGRTVQSSRQLSSARSAPAAAHAPRAWSTAPRAVDEQTIDAWGRTTPKRRVGRRTLVGLGLAAIAFPLAMAAHLLTESEALETTVLSAPPGPPPSTAARPARTAERHAAPHPSTEDDLTGRSMEAPRALALPSPAFVPWSTPSSSARPTNPPVSKIPSPRQGGSSRRAAARETRAPAPATMPSATVPSATVPSATVPTPNAVYDERK